MAYIYKKAVREQTPVIVGLAGPSKSGKTYSALRLAQGMAQGGKIVMINTEGKRGHQYADKFDYLATDLSEPYTMTSYKEAIQAAAEIKPAVCIIDSMSHAHEGIGGMLDQHEKELDRLAKGGSFEKRQKLTWAAWIKPKADEANMVNVMLQQDFHIILCFRAKEKIKIIQGKQPKDLGWQPIASDRISFETAFTLILPPNSKGTPDLTEQGSELREPFDTMIKPVQINEALGTQIAQWSDGGHKTNPPHEGAGKQDMSPPASEPASSSSLYNSYVSDLNAADNMWALSLFAEKIAASKQSGALTPDEVNTLKDIYNERKKYIKELDEKEA